MITDHAIITRQKPNIWIRLPKKKSPVLLRSFTAVEIVKIIEIILSGMSMADTAILIGKLSLKNTVRIIVPTVIIIPTINRMVRAKLLFVIMLCLSDDLCLFMFLIFYSDIFVIHIIKPEKAKINNSLKLVSKFGITHKEKR